MNKLKYLFDNLYHTFLIVLIGLIKIAFPISLRAQDSLRMTIYQKIETSNFNWNIAGNMLGEKPNILSELNFKNLLSLGTGIGLSYKPYKVLELSASYAFLRNLSGKGTDIDYQEDNRTGQTSLLYFESENGWYSQLNLSVLYLFFKDTKFNLGAGINVFVYRRKFGLHSTEDSDLTSYYKYRTDGFGLKIKKDYQISPIFSLQGDFIMNRVYYNSYGNWNLINNFEHPKSFTHLSKGINIGYSLRFSTKIKNQFSIFFVYDYLTEKTSDGVDTLFLKNGSRPTTKLNQTHLSIHGLRLGIILPLFFN